jgi:hypothetical protein
VTDEGRVFDEGLQLERTALAWQRALLTLAAASLAIGRGLETAIGASSWLIAGAGLTVTLTLFVTVRRRYVAAHKHLTTIDSTSLPSDARLIAACALLGLVAGIAALAFVLHAAR